MEIDEGIRTDGPPGVGFRRVQLGAVLAADLLTDLTEIAVGVGCLVSAPFALRSARWLGVLLAIAGLAALIHAAISMAT